MKITKIKSIFVGVTAPGVPQEDQKHFELGF